MPKGRVPLSSHGWWQLESNVDQSLLVVFGYQLRAPGLTPILPAMITERGKRFFPDADVPQTDPDAPEGGPASDLPPGVVKVGQSATALVGDPLVIVAFGLTTCKLRPDFEPGEVLGAGRLYPHVMVTCNQPLDRAECSLLTERPAQSIMAKFDPEMQPAIGMGMWTDNNQDLRAAVNFLYPLPLWSTFFDYYDVDPGQEEYCFVDPSKTSERTVKGLIRRAGEVSDFVKKARQGAYDNVHVAPRMRYWNPATKLEIKDIVMAPFCWHDCLHTHTRWGTIGDEGWAVKLPKSNKGFDGRQPYVTPGAPLVPANQAVYIARTSAAAYRYRAVAQGPIKPGTFSTFNHHGSGYALKIADPGKVSNARFGVDTYITGVVDHEPYVKPSELLSLAPKQAMLLDVSAEASPAAFYQRLRYGGTTASSGLFSSTKNEWKERIQVTPENLEKCRDS